MKKRPLLEEMPIPAERRPGPRRLTFYLFEGPITRAKHMKPENGIEASNYDQLASWLKLKQDQGATEAYVVIAGKERELWQFVTMPGKLLPRKLRRYDGRDDLGDWKLVGHFIRAGEDARMPWLMKYSQNWSTRRAFSNRGIGEPPPAGWANHRPVPEGIVRND